MTPDKPQDPQQGKPDEAKIAEDAAAAKEIVEETPAQPEPEATETDAAPEAEGTAAAETGVDKLAADVEAVADADEPQAASGDDDPAAKAGDEVEETPDEEPPAEAVAEEEPKAKRRAKKAPAAPAEDEKPKRGRGRGRKAEEPKAVPVGLKVSAQAKYVRTSARKARLVCDHIRGKDVTEARAVLAFTTRDAAKPWSKLLESAVANAEHNHELVGEDLRILDVHADEGPTLKRYRPRAMGRATRIRKRTSHLSITLTPKES
jgi:ribosomal protein L22